MPQLCVLFRYQFIMINYRQNFWIDRLNSKYYINLEAMKPPSILCIEKSGKRIIRNNLSQARVNLFHDMIIRIGSPISANLIRCRGNWELSDIGRTFENVHVQATGKMPSNMTMKRPYTWIICIPLNDLLSIC